MKLSSVNRQSARITSFNKYNQSFYFVLKELCTDIVFELDNGKKICKTVINLNLPIHAGQSINLISIDDTIIAFEDKDTNEYFYLSNDPAIDLGAEIISWKSIIIATIILYFLFTTLIPIKSEYVGFVFLLPLCFRIFRGFQNEYFEKKLDNLIEK